MKVLIIEDNLELSKNMHNFLMQEGYICEISTNFHDAEDKLCSFLYDCIILDVMLPDGNGLDLLQLIRQKRIESNVLIVSAKNALDDKINGLDLGADDYITKPFHLSELHARIKAIYRRKNLGGDNKVRFHEISIDTDKIEVKVGEHALELTKKEFDLLLYLVINKNRVITRQSIAEHLWGDYTDTFDNFDFVYQHVKNLRKKLNVHCVKDYIETVYGLGYKFNSYA